MTKKPRRRSRNIGLIYAIQAMNGAMVFIPVVVLFLQEHGLTLKDVFLLQTAFACTVLVGEIPTGYAADRWGRRRTMILGTTIHCLGLLFYCFGTGFWWFLAAETVMGVGLSFLSGTVDAFTYDTLLEEGRSTESRTVIGQSRFWFFAAEGVASLCGGYLATIGLRWTFWAALLPFALSIILAILTTEPRRHAIQGHAHLAMMWKISVDALVRHPAIRMIIVLNAILSALGLGLFWFTQPYQTLVGLPLPLFGLMHAIIVTSGAVASMYVHSMERWMDDRLFLILIATTMVAGFLVLGNIVALPALLVFPLVRIGWAFAVPLTSDMVNRMTDSSVRATVLSAKAFGQRLLFAITAPLLGYMADVFTLQTALLITGTIGGVTALATFLAMRPVWKQIPR